MSDPGASGPGGVGGPGSPSGGAPGGGGFGGGGFAPMGFDFSGVDPSNPFGNVSAPGFFGGSADPDPIVAQSQRTFMNTVLNLIPPTAMVQALLYGGTGRGLGDIAQGGPAPAPGGGPADPAPVSQTMKAIEQVIAPPPVAQPAAKPMLDDRKRKRIGRQETILTKRSALSEAPTSRPTLLGQ